MLESRIECDLLITTVPFTSTDKPLQAPAILKSIVESKGYTAVTHDLNFEFVKSDSKHLDLLKQYFSFGTINNADDLSIAENYVTEVATKLLQKYNPKFLAMSLFTYQCQTFGSLLAQNIRNINPKIKIIFGGQGIQDSGIQSKNSWVESCKNLGLIDHYIVSEGEKALLDLLAKGQGKGVDKQDWEQMTNLDDAPYPNYDDYDLAKYGQKTLMITGSRGCVRKCTFCDIHKHWKKFVYRSGKSIAEEMISQSKKYQIYTFAFTDSLINGSMKAYRDFITYLAEYNQQTTKKIYWKGQYIVRGLSAMTENDWKLTKLSGAVELALGIESGSEAVRDHMKKQFSDKDLDEFVHQAYINDIKLNFLMIVGYPTETHTDFIQTLKMFKKYQKYQKVIAEVILGSTLGILAGTPLSTDLGNDLQINGGENFWIYNKNPTLDFRERIKRRMILGEELQKMNYNVENEDNYKLLHYLWNLYKNKQKQNIVDLNTENFNQQKYS